MTWPDRIAAVLGLTTALLIVIDQHKHRSNTQRADPQDADPQDGERQ